MSNSHSEIQTSKILSPIEIYYKMRLVSNGNGLVGIVNNPAQLEIALGDSGFSPTPNFGHYGGIQGKWQEWRRTNYIPPHITDKKAPVKSFVALYDRGKEPLTLFSGKVESASSSFDNDLDEIMRKMAKDAIESTGGCHTYKSLKYPTLTAVGMGALGTVGLFFQKNIIDKNIVDYAGVVLAAAGLDSYNDIIDYAKENLGNIFMGLASIVGAVASLVLVSRVFHNSMGKKDDSMEKKDERKLNECLSGMPKMAYSFSYGQDALDAIFSEHEQAKYQNSLIAFAESIRREGIKIDQSKITDMFDFFRLLRDNEKSAIMKLSSFGLSEKEIVIVMGYAKGHGSKEVVTGIRDG